MIQHARLNIAMDTVRDTEQRSTSFGLRPIITKALGDPLVPLNGRKNEIPDSC